MQASHDRSASTSAQAQPRTFTTTQRKRAIRQHQTRRTTQTRQIKGQRLSQCQIAQRKQTFDAFANLNLDAKYKQKQNALSIINCFRLSTLEKTHKSRSLKIFRRARTAGSPPLLRTFSDLVLNFCSDSSTAFCRKRRFTISCDCVICCFSSSLFLISCCFNFCFNSVSCHHSAAQCL